MKNNRIIKILQWCIGGMLVLLISQGGYVSGMSYPADTSGEGPDFGGFGTEGVDFGGGGDFSGGGDW